MIFRPSESSRRIADFYRRYLLTTFGTNNEGYNKQLKEALEKEGAIAKGPFISMSDPYEKGSTIRELCKEGVLSKEILKLDSFHPDREPFLLPEEVSCHILRHTFCTRLCENESNIKIIQSIMGHADITTTMNIYADATKEKKQEVMAHLEGKIII